MIQTTLNLKHLENPVNPVFANHEILMTKEKKAAPNCSLTESLEAILEEEDNDLPCLACHL
jgi:hypothetical protein